LVIVNIAIGEDSAEDLWLLGEALAVPRTTK
jgi:hypothetical protein